MPETNPVKIVIHYAPEDAVFFTVLNKQLSLLERQGIVSLWHNGKVQLGANILKETIEQIQVAQLVVLLVSIDYLTSVDFGTIANLFKGLPNTAIVPVITGYCNWELYPELTNYNALPLDKTPISDKSEKAIFEEVIHVLTKQITDISAHPELFKPKRVHLPGNLPNNSNDQHEVKLLPLKYTCNRSTQKGEFLKSTLMSRNERIQYFYIRGIVRQSTEGLFRRFYYQEIPKFYRNKNISPHFVYVPVVPDNDLQVFILNFLDELSMQLKSNNDDIYTDQNITALLNAVCVKSYDVVCVGFKMRSEVWNQQVLAFIRWFIDNFCKHNRTDIPQFLFFFMIDYAEVQHKTQIELELLQLQKELKENNTEVSLLSPLQQVSSVDVDVWLDTYLQDTDKQANLKEHYFKDQTQYDMYDIERNLELIIKQYNREIQKALDD